MSDIVHRLRDWRNLHLALGGELFEAAADEIERLRKGAVAGCETVRLTDAEREAINVARIELNTLHCFEEHHSHTLLKLLERTQ
jgi:hypothetical protein